MTSKEALYFLITNQKKFRDGFKFVNLKTHETATVEDCYGTIMRDLEILEILKNKTVAIFLIPNCQSAYDYSMKTVGFKSLTDKEFTLIKEWLENDK